MWIEGDCGLINLDNIESIKIGKDEEDKYHPDLIYAIGVSGESYYLGVVGDVCGCEAQEKIKYRLQRNSILKSLLENESVRILKYADFVGVLQKFTIDKTKEICERAMEKERLMEEWEEKLNRELDERGLK